MKRLAGAITAAFPCLSVLSYPCSGVQLVLEKESFTLEDLLQQTEIIQETQSQGPKLLE